jgi:tetratricopeptide (TPR) repeat protein
MARRLDDPALLAALLASRATIFTSSEAPEESARLLAELERLCASDLTLGSELLGWRPWPTTAGFAFSGLLRLGRGGEVDACMARMRSLLGDSDHPVEQVSFHSRAGQLRALRGDASGALEHGRQALEWGMKSQNLFIRSVAHSARGRGLLSVGRLDEALEQLEQSLELAIDRAQGKHYAAGEGVPLLAEIQLRRGDILAARTASERGLELARSMGFRHSEARNGILMARALAAAGDAAGAASALTHASELATALAARDLLPSVEEARAELARLRGDHAVCERALRAAARMHRENGEEWQAKEAEARIGV